MNSPEPIPQRRRRWFRFSLRTFIIVITIGCAILGYWSYKAEEQRSVVEWANDNGGFVVYDIHDGRLGHKPSQRLPQFVYNLVGIDYFCAVTYVSFQGREDVDSIEPIAKLKNLNYLDLQASGVSDLSPVAGLPHLSSLNINDTKVSDLHPLRELPNLEHLTLDNTHVSDLTPLETATQLEYLSFSSTSVSDLGPLKHLRHLKTLWMKNTNVRDVTPLTHLRNLRSVVLENTHVSDKQKEDVRISNPYCVIY